MYLLQESQQLPYFLDLCVKAAGAAVPQIQQTLFDTKKKSIIDNLKN